MRNEKRLNMHEAENVLRAFYNQREHVLKKCSGEYSEEDLLKKYQIDREDGFVVWYSSKDLAYYYLSELGITTQPNPSGGVSGEVLKKSIETYRDKLKENKSKLTGLLSKYESLHPKRNPIKDIIEFTDQTIENLDYALELIEKSSKRKSFGAQLWSKWGKEDVRWYIMFLIAVVALVISYFAWQDSKQPTKDGGSESDTTEIHFDSEQANAEIEQKGGLDTLIAASVESSTPGRELYLQVSDPIELEKERLVITLTTFIEAANQPIQLRVVDKEREASIVTEKKQIGDLIVLEDYVITLLELKHNISLYDLKIKIEPRVRKDD